MASNFRACWRLLVAPCVLAAILLLMGAPQRASAQSIDEGLVGYWTFDEGSGATSADLSGSGNTATLHTPNSFTANAAPTEYANPFAWASSLSNQSYVTAPGNNIDALQQITIAFWARFSTAQAQNNMLLVRLPGANGINPKVVIVHVKASNSVAVRIVFPPGIFLGLEAPDPPQDGSYHHYAFTFDDQHARLYFDGKLRDSRELGDILPEYKQLGQGSGVMLSHPDLPLDGAIDDLRIYNRALSPEEVAILGYNCGGAQGLPVSECNSLKSLFVGTQGSGWTNNTNWVANNTPCTWNGVLCVNDHVQALFLPQNNLAGSLNPNLSDLTELIVLNLANNHLSGPIPLELGSLAKLQTLELFNNQLEGPVPFTLGNLTKLTTLRLYGNRLRDFLPPQLANLNQLPKLDVGYNMLTAFDPNLLAFLAVRQPDWAATQTLPPTNLRATARTGTSVQLTWDPISYTADGGYYQVLAAPQATGVYTVAGVTSDKNANTFRVGGLTAGQNYSFLLRTYTPRHGEQQNDLLSDSTDPVTATPVTLPVTITIALDVQPDSRTNFVFTGTLGAFTLDDITPQDGDAFKSSKTFVVPAGVYTITEYPVTDYLDAGISCSPPADTIADLTNHQVTIDAANGANVTCTFVQQRASQIIAGKYNDRNHNHVRNNNEEWLNGWQMEMHNPFTPEIAAQPTSGEGRTVYQNLFAGTYTVCELRKTGWFNITPTVQDATYQQPCYTFAVAPGQAVWVRFGNSTTPAMASGAAAGEAPIVDIVVCDLPATNDDGSVMGPERDPWEEEEEAGNTVFLPIVEH